MPRLYPSLLLSLLIAWPASATTMDWTFIGDPGNPGDQTNASCGTSFNQPCGEVSYTYSIGTYEVTNAQYAEFLNAKAAVSDPHDLYSEGGAIVRSGIAGSYTYTPAPGRENKPFAPVKFYAALRFTNWLNNGEGGGDTESGAYTYQGPGEAGREHWSARNPGALIVVANNDEWYKAAYYDRVSGSYNPFAFADGFNGIACEAPPGTTSHSGNCDPSSNGTTDVGAYTMSQSAYGTFDQSANVVEWVDTGAGRILRTGSTSFDAIGWNDRDGASWLGFRLAMIPEPGTGLLVTAGLIGLCSWRKTRG